MSDTTLSFKYRQKCVKSQASGLFAKQQYSSEKCGIAENVDFRKCRIGARARTRISASFLQENSKLKAPAVSAALLNLPLPSQKRFRKKRHVGDEHEDCELYNQKRNDAFDDAGKRLIESIRGNKQIHTDRRRQKSD